MNLDEPLDLVSAESREFLKRLQGNILESHGRKSSRLIVAQFHAEAPEKRKQVAEWIAAFADEFVKTAADENDARLKDGKKDGPFAMVLLTFAGYCSLGLERIAPKNLYFRAGIKQPNEWAPERDTAQWDAAYRDKRIDALFLVAGDDVEANRLADRILDPSAKIAKAGLVTFLAAEQGRRIFENGDPNKPPIEHFGFRDGISQPCFFRKRPAPDGGPARWSSETPLGVVLAEDPGSNDYGSFMAFLKLEQHISEFKTSASSLVEELGLKGTKAVDYAKALIMGRSQRGTPVVKLAENGSTPWDERAERLDALDKDSAELNDFDYRADPRGEFCPFHAHVRKMNPREDRFGTPFWRRAVKDRADDVYVRIARRGIPYEENTGGSASKGKKARNNDSKKGLLFMSFQSDLAQFLFHEWAADYPHFVKAQTGADALTGRTPPDAEVSTHRWPSQNGPKDPVILPALAGFVTPRGGEFFFAPSMAVLRALPRLVAQASR